jgi:hypothetical protein
VTSGKEALLLLLVSFRTLADVKFRLKFKEKIWELSIAIREWSDLLDPSLEFRSFARNGSLNAMCQYFYDCYFPELKDEAVINKISIRYSDLHNSCH